MSVIRIILTVLFIIDCIGLTIIVLMQEGKSAGLGAISGAIGVRIKVVPWKARL